MLLLTDVTEVVRLFYFTPSRFFENESFISEKVL